MSETTHGRIDRLTDQLLGVLAQVQGACRHDRKCLLEQGQAIIRMIAYSPRPKRAGAAYGNGNGAAANSGVVATHHR